MLVNLQQLQAMELAESASMGTDFLSHFEIAEINKRNFVCSILLMPTWNTWYFI